MYPIWDFGTEEQKQRYLPGMTSGELIGCFGLTEPDYGSNPGDMVTKAEDKGDHFLLNGAKMWITNGSIADLAIVWAKLDGVIRGFIVEKDDEGFSAPEMTGKHSLKASVTSELVFQDCRIPKDRILPNVKGLRPLLMSEQRPIRNLVGGLGSDNGMLPLCEDICAVENPIRPAHRRLPTRPEQTRMDAERDHERTTPRLSPWQEEG